MRTLILPLVLALVPAAAAGAEPAADPAPTSPHPVRPTWTENADFAPKGSVSGEAAYRIEFASLDRQVVTLRVAHVVAERFEYRIGWDVLGIQELPIDSDSGVGDLWAQLRFHAWEDDAREHRIAVLTEVRPGIGQFPVTNDALGVGGYALWSTRPGPVDVSARAGLDLLLRERDPGFALPLAGSVHWEAATDFRVFGEVFERLTLNDLSASETSVLAGVDYRIVPGLVVDFSTRLGLSDTLPDAVVMLGFSFALGRL